MGIICLDDMETTIRHAHGLTSGNGCDHKILNISLENNTASLSSEKIFVKPGPFVYYSIGSLLTCVMIIGFTANLSVLYAYAKLRQIRTTDNTLLIGLALSDIGQSILGIPFVVIACFTRRWIFGHVLCQFYAFITTSLGISQITTLTLIATERYFIIVQHNRKISNTRRKGAAVIACSFIYGSLWATGPLLGWSKYKEEEIGIACCVKWEVNNIIALSYTISLCVIGWLLPLMLIGFGYISIAISIHSEQAKRQYLQSSSVNKKNRRERKVAITILMMIGAFVVSWMPYSIVSLWSAFGDFKSIPLGVQVAPAIFAKCSIIWNPMIYVARHKHFRRGVKRSVPCFHLLLRNRSQSSDSKEVKHETNEQQRNLTIPEAREVAVLKYSSTESESSEIATRNKFSVACSTHRTSSVWFETPTSLRKDQERFCFEQDDKSSSDADSTFYDDVISNPVVFQTIGTQTDMPSPLRLSFEQHVHSKSATKYHNYPENCSVMRDNDSSMKPTPSKSYSMTDNLYVDALHRRETMLKRQFPVERRATLVHVTQAQEPDNEGRHLTFDLVNSTQQRRYLRMNRYYSNCSFKVTGNHQNTDHSNQTHLMHLREHQNCDILRNRTRHRIASEPIKGRSKHYFELSNTPERKRAVCNQDVSDVDNETSQLIRQTTV